MSHQKSCDTCRHVSACHFYRLGLQLVDAYNQEGESVGVKFPIEPTMIAQGCPLFESELDVKKITELHDGV